MAFLSTPTGRRGFLRLSALAGLATLPAFRPALAQDPGALIAAVDNPHGSGFYRFAIGGIAGTVVSDGAGSFPVWPVFASNSDEAGVTALLDRNFIAPPVAQVTSNILVLDTGTERVMIDTGAGATFGPTFGRLKANLAAAGIDPGSITVIALTHGHSDHIAGLTEADGTLVFPNARYVMVDAEFDYWTGTAFESDIGGSALPDEFKAMLIGAAKANLPAIAERTTMVKPGGEIVSGVSFVAAPGHTPAHSAVLVESEGVQLLHTADVVHNPITGLQRPEWTPIFDSDPTTAVATRKAIADRAAAERLLVLAYHFPFPALGHVERVESAYRWVPAPWVW